MKLLPFFFFLLVFRVSFADTTWLDKKFKECPASSSTYYSFIEPRGDLFNRRIYYTANNALYSHGTYKDTALQLRWGLSASYAMDGRPLDTIIYRDNLPVYITLYHGNGMKKTVLIRNSKGDPSYVNSWNAEGAVVQQDTFYHDARGLYAHRDTAYSKGIINQEDSVWRLRFYHTANDSLYTTGYFKERLCRTRCRYGSWYQRGMLWDSLLYNENGKKREAWYYYRSGKLNAHQVYNENGKITLAENWDEHGKVAKPDTMFRWPLPVEGFKTWEKNIIRKINNDKTIDPKTRRDMYGNVHLRFCITEDGNLGFVQIQDPSIYPEMDSIILNAFAETKNWTPSTRHGRKQAYYGRKVFSFVAGIVIKAKDMYY